MRTSLEKFEKQGRISIKWSESALRQETSEKVRKRQVEVTNDYPLITITGWKRYQSEYLRQIEGVKARKSKRSTPQFDGLSHQTSTQLPNTEEEEEGERERDVEKEGKKKSRAVRRDSAPDAKPPSPLAFRGIHLQLTERQDKLLGNAFPWVDRPDEYRKMDSWLEANPQNRPKKHSQFAHNWFNRIHSPGGSSGQLNRAEKRTKGNLEAAGFVEGGT